MSFGLVVIFLRPKISPIAMQTGDNVLGEIYHHVHHREDCCCNDRNHGTYHKDTMPETIETLLPIQKHNINLFFLFFIQIRVIARIYKYIIPYF